MSEEERAELGKMGRAHIDKNYNFNDFCDKWVEPSMLNSLIKSISRFTPEYVAKRCDVDQGAIIEAALMFATKTMATELGVMNIRVNAISAGPLDTLSSRVISHYRDMKRIHGEKAPLKRNITVDEVAKTALFLSSDLSSGITGEILHVDTGYNIMGL